MKEKTTIPSKVYLVVSLNRSGIVVKKMFVSEEKAEEQRKEWAKVYGLEYTWVEEYVLVD